MIDLILRVLWIPARPIPLGWFVAFGNYRVESLAVGPLAAQGSISRIPEQARNHLAIVGDLDGTAHRTHVLVVGVDSEGRTE